jgi:inosine-uridine nucleoside N-ribohydrolase
MHTTQAASLCAGHDDALAILLAGYHPKVKLCGISTAASNQVNPCKLRNAQRSLCLQLVETAGPAML